VNEINDTDKQYRTIKDQRRALGALNKQVKAMKSEGKTGRCTYPKCMLIATTSWALVPMCEDHRELIADETARHYKGEGGSAEAASRPCYMKIAHLIPWSKLMLGKFDATPAATPPTPLTAEQPKKRGRKRIHGTCIHCNKKYRLEFLAEHEHHCKGARRR
jgi:hypothetical protein